MQWVALCVSLVIAAEAAQAGAWTLERGQWAVFAGAIASTAPRLYDNDGGSAKHVVFRKLQLQSRVEYGVLDSVTLFAVPEYVLAKSDMDGSGDKIVDTVSVEGGMRVLLLSRIGMLSLQVSGKSAGAFDMSVSSTGEAGWQFETRLLYGRSFKLWGHDAFFDIQAAQRWVARPRPDELVFDGTVGYWLTRNNLLLVQSFNFMTTGAVRSSYQPYMLSKLQVSLVHKLSRRWSFQPGYFMSLTGRNIVKESGIVGTFWFQT